MFFIILHWNLDIIIEFNCEAIALSTYYSSSNKNRTYQDYILWCSNPGVSFKLRDQEPSKH